MNNKLAALQSVVEMGDNRPTEQSLAVFKDLSGRLDKEIARLDAIARRDLAAFNGLLTKRKLQAVGS